MGSLCSTLLIQVMPKQPGFEKRRDLYLLYHYLNHYNLFGSGYRSSAMSIIDDYLRMLKAQLLPFPSKENRMKKKYVYLTFFFYILQSQYICFEFIMTSLHHRINRKVLKSVNILLLIHRDPVSGCARCRARAMYSFLFVIFLWCGL